MRPLSFTTAVCYRRRHRRCLRYRRKPPPRPPPPQRSPLHAAIQDKEEAFDIIKIKKQLPAGTCCRDFVVVAPVREDWRGLSRLIDVTLSSYLTAGVPGTKFVGRDRRPFGERLDIQRRDRVGAAHHHGHPVRRLVSLAGALFPRKHRTERRRHSSDTTTLLCEKPVNSPFCRSRFELRRTSNKRTTTTVPPKTAKTSKYGVNT